jgi:ribosomal protein S18 acetylase RimI-like enzyme
LLIIHTLVEIIWVPFKTIARTISTHVYLRSSVPTLLTNYRKTQFTLQDGLSEWKGEGGLLFATKDEKLMGMLRLDQKRTYCELSSFVVDSSHRGLGCGKQLLQHAIDNTDLPIWLRVQRDNPACDLYSRCGFESRDLVNDRFVMRLR